MLGVAVLLVVAGAAAGLHALAGPGGVLSDLRGERWELDLYPDDDRATAVLAGTLARMPGVVDVVVEDADAGVLTVLVDPDDADAARLAEQVCRDARPQWGGWFDPDDLGASCTVRAAG